MKYALCLIGVFVIDLIHAEPQSLRPLQIVESYVSPRGFPDKQAYVCCELLDEHNLDSTLNQLLPSKAQRFCRLIRQDSNTACVGVWLYDKAVSKDYYFFLHKQKGWTIKAIRSMNYSESVRQELKQLESMPNGENDPFYTLAHPHSYAFDKANLKLWLSSDSILKKHFYENEHHFQALLIALQKRGCIGKPDSVLSHIAKQPPVRTPMDELLLRGLSSDRGYPDCLLFLIGGIDNNRIGYLYQPDLGKIPPLSERNYILLESLGNGWYLFKST